MKLLITGASGFLGSHLARHLLQVGHIPILLKRSTSNTWRLDDIIDRVPSYSADDMDDYSSLFETHDIDIIIHTATQYSRNNINANEIISANVLFPAKILDCAIQYNVKCFINTDTFTQADYGNLKFYGLSKAQFRQWVV